MSDRYRKGAHCVYDIKYHFVWKTKYSYRVLKEKVDKKLRQIIMEICKEKRFHIVSGNVRPNHVHILVSCPSNIAPSQVVQFLKGKSSYRLQREFREIQKRYWGGSLWGRGYFCATVGALSEEMIKRYVENQDDDVANFRVWDEKPDKSKHILQPDENPEQSRLQP